MFVVGVGYGADSRRLRLVVGFYLLRRFRIYVGCLRRCAAEKERRADQQREGHKIQDTQLRFPNLPPTIHKLFFHGTPFLFGVAREPSLPDFYRWRFV
jgi:hypothetical protein